MSTIPPRGTPRYLALTILVLIYMLSAMDRQLVSILAQPIKTDLGLSDTELGFLTGTSFAIFYVIAGVPISWLADRFSRRRIIVAACLLWSLLTALCSVTRNFAQMAAVRMAVGIGEAGGTAPSLSLISDFFPPQERAKASAIYIVGTPLGVVVGTIFAGFFSAIYGWRVAFFAAGALGILITPLLFLIREPVRGRFDTEHRVEPMSTKEIGVLLSRPVIILLLVSVALNAMASLTLLTWTPAFLMRSRGMNIADLAIWYSPLMGIALSVGPWIAGWIVDRRSLAAPHIYGSLPALSCLLAAPMLFAALTLHQWQMSLLLISVAAFLAVMYFGPSMALLHNLAPASGRTTSTAVLVLILNMSGLGFGPLLIGKASDLLTPAFGADSLQMALMTMIPALLASALSYAILARLIHRHGLEQLRHVMA